MKRGRKRGKGPGGEDERKRYGGYEEVGRRGGEE